MNAKNEEYNEANITTCCRNSDCCPPADTGRRSFIKTAGLSAAALLTSHAEIMAGPFDAKTANEFDKVIPADKRLSKQWIEGLYARGEALTATGESLNNIGMPITGLGTGQIYLSGDGRLWNWNLTAKKGKKHNPKGPSYADPDQAKPSDWQGFAIRVGDKIRTLDSTGFKKVRFTNRYPMALVEFADDDYPVDVRLEAYTPFIPLNRDESSYPVIVMRYTLTNTDAASQEISIAGWIENRLNGPKAPKINVFQRSDKISTVECIGKDANSQSLAVGLLGPDRPDFVNLTKRQPGVADIFADASLENGQREKAEPGQRSFASLGRTIALQPGQSETVTFTVSFRIPNVRYGTAFGNNKKSTTPGRYHYATLWSTASESAGQFADRETNLYENSKKWTDTWYDSTLPYWFLERAFIPIDCMQTQVAQRVYPPEGTQDIYNLEEGVRCCPGNCTHVWNYAQGLARIFPEIERECRDRIEYGLGFNKRKGIISHRYVGGGKENARFGDALDGNCGTIIRVYRESQMTTDYTFLTSIWDRVKLSMDHVIEKWDADENGMLSGPQHNTLDEPWHGEVAWLINVYHAALKVSATMARQMKQPNVAARYESIVAQGLPSMIDRLWNEEFGYFIHVPPNDEKRMHGATNGCHIDQVLGDSWLHEVGLDPLLPRDKTRRALQSLWKFNFAPDVGPFRKKMTNGRWYAVAGDAGLVMCSFPFGKIEPKSGKKSYAGYLNECMTGFEWQVAAHMIREGMVEQGLAIGKAIYDRYTPQKRNPYNEIECSDHYSRAMASYGAYLAACGYHYDGPQGKLGFAPKIFPEFFRAAFTTAEGWGSFRQNIESGKQSAAIELAYGKLTLNELQLGSLDATTVTSAEVRLAGKPIETTLQKRKGIVSISFNAATTIQAGQQLQIALR